MGLQADVPAGSLVAIPPHEDLVKDWEASDGLKVALDEAIVDRSLPQAYFNHPLVQRYGSEGHVLP